VYKRQLLVPEKKSHHHGLIVTILIVSLLLNAFSVYLLMGFSLPLKAISGAANQDNSIGIKRALLDLEYEKVGGKENYDTLQKYSQMQIKDQIDKIKQYVAGGAVPSQDTPAPAVAVEGTLTQDEVKKILDDASIEGNISASVIAIEYSDMECPFCMRQYHDTKLFPALLAQYGDKVSVAFKNNRGVNHK
jgi:protein-disulfide isomerase